jgi:tripartite-type tricarboxylate transporter receptor subunit TctC
VPYRGVAPALTNLLGGQVQVVFGAVTATMPYIGTGKVRALAVTGTARSKLLPDIPTVGELVPGYEASAWYGIGAPKDTPRHARQFGRCHASSRDVRITKRRFKRARHQSHP